MPLIDEATAAPPPLGSDLRAGIDEIAANQTILFTRYVRLVMPLDGYVFWVRANLVTPSAVFNASAMNTAEFNEPQLVETAAQQIQAAGSLHYAVERRQVESDSISVNRIVFTSKTRIEDLDQVGPGSIYIGEYEDQRFAFSSRKNYFQQADLFHYVGDAIYPDMSPQVVDDPSELNTRDVIVSNSLPLWLALNNYQPFYGFGNSIPLYPSFLVPANVVPPYGTVHVVPGTTRGVMMAPQIGRYSSHEQFCSERVVITLLGLHNRQALDFMDCVNQYSLDTEVFGIANIPALQDEKRTQEELAVISMRKTIEFEINYWQNRVNDVARQLICRVIQTYVPN